MALIDRDALGVGHCNPNSMLDSAYAVGWNGLLNIINSAPAADAVPVVRCRECSNYIEYDDWDRDRAESFKCHECNILHRDFGAEGFCSYGERKDHD